MHPIVIIVSFFAVLAALIAGAALAQKKLVRMLAAVAAFGWACLMFMVASWAESLNHNIWYSSAASKMLDACIGGIEQGHQEAVLAEMRRMTNELEVTYERRGNFKQLAERAAESLTATNAEPAVGASGRQPFSSETNRTPAAVGSGR
jgi:signal transduction histidine kinase